ncbi:hypothetical protein AJ78_01154 [Emergomyces pasteurianus Ep9510]|uniref:Uncharacterized protein n=1 Tax=Emergomyces pasteurianus Ep9510 TaxID=1447872 RepID=A0A1J9PRH6_9EURO|nr:hypothetical protein AJ78_01154 [Emergomyces pasteurianus Ep9510]
MPSSSDPTIVCAEIIGISSLLHTIPVPPSRNRIDCLLPSETHYTLPFDAERKLAGTLAFLAYSKDDIDHIPAICLEEDPDLGALKVIFAVNKANSEDGSEAIRLIEHGFDGIFAILAGMAIGIEKQILTSIVSMCAPRILSRLRLARSGRKPIKRPFQETLRAGVFAVKNISRQKLQERKLLKTAEQFIKSAKEVEKLIDSWSRYRVINRLLEIVEGLRRLQEIERLPDLINTIPNLDMDPTSRQSLLNIVGKVSRYWEAARFLYRTAKKFPLACAMRAIPVHLPGKAYDTPLFENYAPDLLSKIVEVTPQGCQQRLLEEICRVLDLTQRNAIDQYSRQVIRTLRGGKVHAEIQLIAHCEIQKPKKYPRVICSSKDACFLCNMFLRECRKIYMPRSHGRLYPGWRLPCLPQLKDLEKRFCQTLKDHSRESCAALMSTRRKVVYPDPNESTLFTLPLSRTTVTDSLSSKPPEIPETGTKVGNSIPTAPNSSQNSINGGSNELRIESLAESEHPQGISWPPQSPHYTVPAGKGHSGCSTLVPGSRARECLIPGETSQTYKAGRLRVQLEYVGGLHNLACCLRLLGVEEARDVQENSSSSPVIDADCLESIVTLHEKKKIHVAASGTMLEVSWASEV